MSASILSVLVLIVPLEVGAAVISDLFKPEERGLAIALYSIAPLLGPVIGKASANHKYSLSDAMCRSYMWRLDSGKNFVALGRKCCLQLHIALC